MASSVPQAPRPSRRAIAAIALTALLVVGPVATRRASAFPGAGESQTTLVTEPPASSWGEEVTLTATVTCVSAPPQPTGSVTFDDTAGDAGRYLGTVPLNADGVATLTLSTLDVGARTLRASYSGSSSCGPSADDDTHLVVGITTATMLTSSPNPSQVGETVTFTAHVVAESPGPNVEGAVGFFDESTGTPLGGMPLASGSASISTSALSVGGHRILALFDPGPGTPFGPSSRDVVHTVDAAPPATTPRASPTATVERAEVTRGDQHAGIGSGFQPGETVSGEQLSTPLSLGTQVADDQGVVRFTWTIRGNETLGEHTFTVVGEVSGRASTTFRVVDRGSMPATRADLAPLAIVALPVLAAGIGLRVAARRSNRYSTLPRRAGRS